MADTGFSMLKSGKMGNSHKVLQLRYKTIHHSLITISFILAFCKKKKRLYNWANVRVWYENRLVFDRIYRIKLLV